MHVAAGGLHPIEHRAHDGADLAVPLEFRILYSAITVTCLSLSLSLFLSLALTLHSAHPSTMHAGGTLSCLLERSGADLRDRSDARTPGYRRLLV